MLKFSVLYIKENKSKILALVLLCLFFIGNLGVLKEHEFSMIRYVAVSDLSKVHPRYDDRLFELSQTFAGQDPREILQSVMNHVQKVESGSRYLAQDIWNHTKNGGGALCAQMATLYGAALDQKGISFRIVSIARALNTRDSHTTIEVRDGENWVLFDPTFNVSFRKNDKLLGAQDIHNDFLKGRPEQIEPVFYGEVNYPSRLENYYVNWLALYNNVQVYSQENISVISRLPPMRYWTGPKAYYQEGNSASDQQYRLHNYIYFLSIVVFPFLIILYSLCILVHFVIRIRLGMHENVLPRQ